jgi:hypothetical protein
MGGLSFQAEVISVHARGMYMKMLGHPLIGKEPDMKGFLNWTLDLLQGVAEVVIKLAAVLGKAAVPIVVYLFKGTVHCTGHILERGGDVSIKAGKALQRTEK